MATTVSRRLVYVKMKNRRAQRKPKPKAPVQDDSQLVDDEQIRKTEYVPKPARGPRAAVEPPPGWAVWQHCLAWFCGLSALAGIVAGVVSIADQLPQTRTNSRSSYNPGTSPGHKRSVGSGQAGSTALGTSSGTGYTGTPQLTAEGFLDSPFPKRKTAKINCSGQMVLSKETVGDFSKCFHPSPVAEAPPPKAGVDVTDVEAK